MSDPLPPYPMPYQTPAPRFYQPNPRPMSVSVLAILAIIFGGLGTPCGWGNFLPYVIGGPTANPVTEAIRSDRVLFAWTMFTFAYGWIMAVVLLIGGIQSLRLRPIGRKLLIAYAWVCIAMAVPGTIMNFLYMMPLMKDVASKNASNPGVASALSAAMVGAVGGVVIGLGVFVYILYVLSRPHVKAAFATGGAPPAPPYYPPPQ